MSRIVAADDDPDVLSLIVNTMRMRGYEVLTASDGQQAWQLVLSEKPSAAILDVNMPGANGFEVCRRIKADPLTRHIPVMFLTARDELTDKVTGFEAGADDYLVKPFQPRELTARVAVLLKRSGDPGATADPGVAVGEVVTLFGAKGGVGTSVLAANLAVSLAQMGKSVCLVDLDLEHAVSAVLFDVLPNRIGSIVELSGSFDSSLDWSHLDRFLVRHQSGVAILPGPNSPLQAELVSGEHIRSYVALLKLHFDYVLVDTVSAFTDLNLDLMELMDELLLVVTPDVPALKAFRGVVEVLAQLGVPSHTGRVVVNHVSPAESVTAEDVRRASSLPVVGSVPFGSAELMNSVNQGIPLAQLRPQHPISVAVKKLAELLAALGSGELRAQL